MNMKEIRFILKKDIPWYKVWFIYKLWEDVNYINELWNYITWRYSIDEMRQNNDFFQEF